MRMRGTPMKKIRARLVAIALLASPAPLLAKDGGGLAAVKNKAARFFQGADATAKETFQKAAEEQARSGAQDQAAIAASDEAQDMLNLRRRALAQLASRHVDAGELTKGPDMDEMQIIYGNSPPVAAPADSRLNKLFVAEMAGRRRVNMSENRATCFYAETKDHAYKIVLNDLLERNWQAASDALVRISHSDTVERVSLTKKVAP